MNINWEAFGAIGEIVGATAVVITIIFLLVQLRQNTKSLNDTKKATVSQLYQFRAQMHMDGMLRKVESSEYSWIELLTKARDEGVDSLTDEELLFLRIHAVADAVRLDNGLFQFRNGLMDEDYFTYIKNAIGNLYPHWKQIGVLESGFRPGFIEEAERIASERGDT